MKRYLQQGSRLSILAIVGLLLFTAGCNRGRSDAEIIGDVVTRIHANPQITNKNVAVMASKGVVTLNGSEPNENERIAVQNTAAQVEGVKTLVNDIMLDGPVGVMPTIAEAPSAPVPTPQPQVTAAPERQQVARKPSAYHERQSTSAKSEVRDTVRPATSNSTASSNSSLANSSTTTSSTANPLPVVGAPSSPLSSIVPSSPAPTPIELVAVPSGTPLSVRLIDSIDSDKSQPGDVFHATLDAPVYVGDQT